MTQHELVVAYIKDRGFILPAKLGGTIYQGIMFGSETSKRCRELRAHKLPSVQKYPILISEGSGKFEVFHFKEYSAWKIHAGIVGDLEPFAVINGNKVKIFGENKQVEIKRNDLGI